MKVDSPTLLQKKIFTAIKEKKLKEEKEKKYLVINTRTSDKPEIGYLSSLLNEISKTERRQGTRAILLAADPKRAKELDEWIWAVGYHASIESACITGEGNRDEQSATIPSGPVILVATPGRLAEILEHNRVIFREVQQLVVDQADLIEEWGPVETISNRVIGKCQRIFTAEKDSKKIRDAEAQILTNPSLVTLKKKQPEKQPKTEEKPSSQPVITRSLTQYYINVPPRSKISTLMAHLESTPTDSVVIFTASRKTADRLYKIFRKNGKRAVSIHGELDDNTFKERFERFVTGNVNHLIAGDMNAAKLDIDNVTQVINYDVLEEVAEYKDRAELVGKGKATRIISLVSRQDRSSIQSLCDSLGYAPEEIPLPKSVKEKVSEPSGSRRSAKPAATRQKRHKSEKHTPRRSQRDRSRSKEKPYKGLPRPTFDQLEGGRTGTPEKEKKGIVGFFKKLFG